MLPKQYQVNLYSDSLARVAFLMIMILSIPIGVHHLFADPGVSEVAKALHSLLTLVVTVPSFLTVFNIAATLERAGRKRGAKGLFGWIVKQAWGDPIIAAQLCGMLLFLAGGITGLMNASYTLNIALHNTTWVPGHFHTTLAGAVFLTYMGITYWLLPLLRGRALFSKNLALAQVYTWFVGMTLFGFTMGRAGIEGATRRTDLGGPGAYVNPNWAPWFNLTALAGAILLVSVVLLFIVWIGTLFLSKKPVETEPPIQTDVPPNTPRWLENWPLWVALIVISNIIMWGPVLLQALSFTQGFWSIGYRMQ
ncbi:MAG: cbb3-type cytochrome c oxidase subunit I, partial [Anaerolinea sp.]|nr:cbb3-type cytochrome c oxidase subunit I [Anaerolinea sp.]